MPGIARNASPAQVRIGVWGSRNAGKTTFLAMLLHVANLGGWKVEPVDDDSNDFINNNHKIIFINHQFPPATEQGTVAHYRYWISPPRHGWAAALPLHSRVELALLDASGEAFENPGAVRSLYPGREDVYDYLATCRGMIFLLDPCRPQPSPGGRVQSYYQIISQAFFELRKRISPNAPSPLRASVAFCLAKMDEPENLPHRMRPRTFGHQLLGPSAVQDIKNKCPKHRFFACSAIGIRNNVPGVMSPNYVEMHDGQRRIVDTEHIQPFGLLEPLEWLFQRISNWPL